MSNVPYIDDEEDVLADLIEEFESTLNIEEISAKIHYYNSLEFKLNSLNENIYSLQFNEALEASFIDKLTAIL